MPKGLALLGLVLANVPDIDFLFGTAVGFPNRFHHLWTHSLCFAVAAGLAMMAVHRKKENSSRTRWGFWVFALVFSHMVLDLFTRDRQEPFGMTLLWPLSSKFFISPFSLFRDVAKSDVWHGFLASLFSVHNFWTVAWEMAVLAPLVTVWIALQKKVGIGRWP
jgi:membrane-bound metal-dependent hydrolase YbcI (DUF457 family)